MPRLAYQRIHELATEQFGVFTTAQAKAAGVDHRALAMMCRRGTLERQAHGVYQDLLVPTNRFTHYMLAALWPVEVPAVLSHETALDLFEISDVNPGKIHITVPKHFRIRRKVPEQYVVHHADLTPTEITSIEGLPVTTAARAIRDCHATHLGPALLRQAIDEGRRLGWITARDQQALATELFPGEAPAGAPRQDP